MDQRQPSTADVIKMDTGVQYVLGADKTVNIKSFSSVSSCLDHGAHAIWAHLQPVLLAISKEHPGVDTVHFVSDGPTAQYRNRFNLWYAANMLTRMCPNVTRMTWNYSEAGHGKGPMDGVGGTLKRTADKHVAYGNDVSNVSDFVRVLQEQTNISITEISDHDVKEMKDILPKKVPAIPGILDLHQVTWTCMKPAIVFTRALSCFECDFDKVCSHYGVGKGYSALDGQPYNTDTALPVVSPTSSSDLAEAPVIVTNISTEVAVGDWVAVIYGSQWYPGLVEEAEDDILSVKFMARSAAGRILSKPHFKWPDFEERDRINAKNILCRIPHGPLPSGSKTRALYVLPDYEEIQTAFMSEIK